MEGDMGKITKIDPKEWKKANIVQIDVDAKDNWEAIEALESWAGDHGFARVHENFLRLIIRSNGSRVFRGACYKLTKEEKNAVHYETRKIAARARIIAGATQSAS
jgi:hypothetical protein